jgi:hypothetical protein
MTLLEREPLLAALAAALREAADGGGRVALVYGEAGIGKTSLAGLEIPITEAGAQGCLAIVGVNASDGVTCLHSYVTPDKKRTFCVYDAPTPEAIRQVAGMRQAAGPGSHNR